MADANSADWTTWNFLGVAMQTYAPTITIRPQHVELGFEASVIIGFLCIYQWYKCVKQQRAGVIPQVVLMYSFSTLCYGLLRTTVQYNKISVFFANWHVLCEIVLLLNILQGERIASRFYDFLLIILWAMSTIFAFLDLKIEILFMQPFGFLADNMLVWVQLIAYYETSMTCYLWGVIGAVIHVVMLTSGILDPLSASGIGLSLAAALLVPMMICYTIFSMEYVNHWKATRWVPYFSLGGQEEPKSKPILQLVEMPMIGRATVSGDSVDETNKLGHLGVSSVSLASSVGLINGNLNDVGLCRTKLRLHRRYGVWGIGLIIGVVWFVALLGALGFL